MTNNTNYNRTLSMLPSSLGDFRKLDSIMVILIIREEYIEKHVKQVKQNFWTASKKNVMDYKKRFNPQKHERNYTQNI